MGEGYWEGTGLVPGPLSNALRAGRREAPEVRLSGHHRGVGGAPLPPWRGSWSVERGRGIGFKTIA